MCRKEIEAVEALCDDDDDEEPSSACLSARGALLMCLANIYEGRRAHAAAWDERLYLQAKELAAAWERLFGQLRPPRPPSCGKRSIEVRSQIFQDEKTAMRFSEAISEALRKSGIALEEDETYLCTICVEKRPQYVSDAMHMDPLGLIGNGARVSYIMEPAVMRQVMREVARDAIRYEPEAK